MTFDGLHTDGIGISFAWGTEQPYVDSSCSSPVGRLHCRLLRTGHPAPRPDFCCARAPDVVRLRPARRRHYADRKATTPTWRVCATRWPLTHDGESTPDPPLPRLAATAARCCCCCCADDDRLVDEGTCTVTHRCTPHPMWTPLQAAVTTPRAGARAAVGKETAAFIKANL